MSVGTVLAINALILFGARTVVWGISIRAKDASVVDIAWGMTFVLTAWVTRFTADGYEPRKNLLVALSTIWGLRLSLYLAKRNLGHGEDPRYVSMRERGGDRWWWWTSLFKVFYLQGLVSWVVSLPIQLGQVSGGAGPFVTLAVIGSVVWMVGIGFEAIGDFQLARFKADPANEGMILDSDLWSWTRHPNYFGDAAIWWGIGIVAASSGWGLIGLVGPLVMNFFLVNISGKKLLEHRMGRNRPGYDDYVSRTSGFFPRPPKS